MVISCSSFNCTNKKSKEQNIISFHRFPLKNEPLLKRWLVAMKRKGFVPNKYSYLCSEHFTPNDYEIRPYGGRRTLKTNATPTVFNFSDNLKASHRKQKPPQHRTSSPVSNPTTSVIYDHTFTSVRTIDPKPALSPQKLALNRKIKTLQQQTHLKPLKTKNSRKNRRKRNIKNKSVHAFKQIKSRLCKEFDDSEENVLPLKSPSSSLAQTYYHDHSYCGIPDVLRTVDYFKDGSSDESSHMESSQDDIPLEIFEVADTKKEDSTKGVLNSSYSLQCAKRQRKPRHSSGQTYDACNDPFSSSKLFQYEKPLEMIVEVDINDYNWNDSMDNTNEEIAVNRTTSPFITKLKVPSKILENTETVCSDKRLDVLRDSESNKNCTDNFRYKIPSGTNSRCKEETCTSSSDDETSEINMHPNDGQLIKQISQILSVTNLERMAVKEIFQSYPEFDLHYRKEFIKSVVRQTLSQIKEEKPFVETFVM